MENYLIVIIFIASIIYKVYSNYKDETEKAKKRQPSRVPMPQPIPNPTNKSTYKEPKPYVPSTATQHNNMVSYEEPSNYIPDEVKKIKDFKENSTLHLKEEETIQKQPIEFDLRQAVINSIILERPYK